MSPVAALDVTGQACPMPLVRTRQAIDELQSGEVLAVVVSDRGALSDFPAWASVVGHTIHSVEDHGNRITFHIEKG